MTMIFTFGERSNLAQTQVSYLAFLKPSYPQQIQALLIKEKGSKPEMQKKKNIMKRRTLFFSLIILEMLKIYCKHLLSYLQSNSVKTNWFYLKSKLMNQLYYFRRRRLEKGKIEKDPRVIEQVVYNVLNVFICTSKVQISSYIFILIEIKC